MRTEEAALPRPSADARERRRTVLLEGLWCVLGVLAGAAAARALCIEAGFAVWYPAAGVLLAHLVRTGARGLPMALLAAGLAEATVVGGDAGAATRTGRVVVVVAAYALAAAVLRRVWPWDGTLRSAGRFVLVGVVVAPAVAAFGAAAIGWAVDGAPSGLLVPIRTHWVGDAIATATLTPLLLSVPGLRRDRTAVRQRPSGRAGRASWRHRLGVLAEAAAVVALPLAVFASATREVVGPALVLAVVPVVWVASRRPLLGALVGSLTLATVAAVGARVRLDAVEQLTAVQFVVLAGAVTTLVAAGALRSAHRHRDAMTARDEYLRALSLRDPRTGLANRAGLLAELDEGIHDGCLLVVLELDRFAAVAAALGDDVTDDLLRAAATRISRSVGDRSELIARIGGGRFALIVPASQALAIAERAVAALASGPLLPGSDLLLGAGAGVAETDPDRALGLRRAEIAAARAVGSTGERVVRFTPDLWEDVVARRELLTGLRLAVQRGELIVRYQPIVDLREGRIVAAEALVRWVHPTRGELAPQDWLPFAERSGLVHSIDEVVIERALTDLAGWRHALEGRAFRLHLNVAPSGIVGHDLPGLLGERCRELDIPPCSLCIELTETTLPEDLDAAVRALRDLRKLGVTIAYDDFGTGYANVAMLRRLPLDELKVDRSLVTGLPGGEDQRGMLRLVAGLANDLGLALTAEGVETEDEREALIDLGYHHGQGFLWARPLAPGDFEQALSAPGPAGPVDGSA